MKKLKTITRRCKTNIGGVKRVFISPHRTYKPYEIQKDKDELISSVNRLFYLQTVSQIKFDESVTFDTSGNISFDITLSFVIWENQKYNGLVKQILNKTFDFILQLNNGKYIYLGYNEGLNLKSCAFQTGQQKNEMIGYSLSFKGVQENGFLSIQNIEDSGFTLVEAEDPIFVLASNENVIQTNNNSIQVL